MVFTPIPKSSLLLKLSQLLLSSPLDIWAKTRNWSEKLNQEAFISKHTWEIPRIVFISHEAGNKQVFRNRMMVHDVKDPEPKSDAKPLYDDLYVETMTSAAAMTARCDLESLQRHHNHNNTGITLVRLSFARASYLVVLVFLDVVSRGALCPGQVTFLGFRLLNANQRRGSLLQFRLGFVYYLIEMCCVSIAINKRIQLLSHRSARALV